MKRLDAIRNLYDRQCKELGLDYWAGWVQGWALKLAQHVPVVVYASDAALRNEGLAGEELALVSQLQAWGVPITIADPRLTTTGYGWMRKRIDEEIAKAIDSATRELRRSWGDEAMDMAGLPQPSLAASGTPPTPPPTPPAHFHG
jgi:hypothetical protein